MSESEALREMNLVDFVITGVDIEYTLNRRTYYHPVGVRRESLSELVGVGTGFGHLRTRDGVGKPYRATH